MSKAGYLADKAKTTGALVELVAAVKFAEYELAAALEIANKVGGLTWAELGEVMADEGICSGSKQATSQWAKRQLGLRLGGLDEAEYARILKLIGGKTGAVRWEVRRIVSGKRGLTAVVHELVSRHLKRDVAEDKIRRMRAEGVRAELYRVLPDGRESRELLSGGVRRPVNGDVYPDPTDEDDVTPF